MKQDLKYIDRPAGRIIDKKSEQPELEPIDVIMPTLDADNFLEKCLYTVYREIPIRKLFVCDGGSKDNTTEILKQFPRVELHVRSDFRTQGKALEFLMSLVETEWFLLLDADIELLPGWYDEMIKNKSAYDVLENSNRILAYHFYREDIKKLREDSRASDLCHLIRKTAVNNFHCDDDFMWRYTDYFLRQIVENDGYKYGKVRSVRHVHNETERIYYESDEEKNYRKLVLKEPQWIIIDKNKANRYNVKNAKAIVKYLDPDHPLVKNNKGLDSLVRLLDRRWVSEVNPKWLKRYNRGRAVLFPIKNFVWKHFIAPKSKGT